MCPPPCGSRRRCSSRSGKPAIKTRISKSEVEEIIMSADFECFCKMSDRPDFEKYEGCNSNLMNILRVSDTTVKVAGRRSEYFEEGKRTVIMDTKCLRLPVVFLFKCNLEE